MDGVGNALLAPLQSTAGAKPAGEAAPATQKNDNKSNASSVKPAALDPVSQPLAPKSLNTLLQSQEDGDSKSEVEGELTPEEQKEVQELKKTDAEVRAHEAAHKTAGGSAAGNVSFETVTGPDGREYAVAGEVQIDVSPVANNPEATLRRMDQVIRAALAPADPSSQDRAVAAQAQQAKLQAQQEIAQKREEEQEEQSESNGLGLLSQGETPANEETNTDIVSILFGS